MSSSAIVDVKKNKVCNVGKVKSFLKLRRQSPTLLRGRFMRFALIVCDIDGGHRLVWRLPGPKSFIMVSVPNVLQVSD